MKFESLNKNEGFKKEKEFKNILKVFIFRHGPKLSAEGEKNDLASYFADHVRAGFEDIQLNKDEKGLVHITSSDVKRAKDTASIYNQELKQSQHRLKADRINNHLTAPYQPEGEAKNENYAKDFETIIKMQAEIKDRVKKEIEDEQRNISPLEMETELRNRIDMEVLSEMFKDENISADEKMFKNSYLDVADDFAQRYRGFFNHLDILSKLKNDQNKLQPENEPYIQIDISHSFQITCFLKKYLVFEDGVLAKDLSPQEFFEKMGGVIRESGSIELIYGIGDAGKKKINIMGEFTKGKKIKGNLEL